MKVELLAKLIKAIDDDFIKRVEEGVGLSHHQWEIINPKLLCLAILQTFILLPEFELK